MKQLYVLKHKMDQRNRDFSVSFVVVGRVPYCTILFVLNFFACGLYSKVGKSAWKDIGQKEEGDMHVIAWRGTKTDMQDG